MKQYLDFIRHIRDNGHVKEDRTGTGTISVFGYQMRFDLNEGFPLATAKKTFIKPIIRELLWFLKGETNIEYLKEHGVKIWDEWALKESDLEELDIKEKPFEMIKKELTELFLKHPHLEVITEVMAKVTKTFKETNSIAGCEGDLMGLGIRPKVAYDKNGKLLQRIPDLHDLGPVYGKQWCSWACPDGRTIDQIKEVIDQIKNKPHSRRLIVSAWNPADLPDETKSPEQNVLEDKAALASCHTMFQFYVIDGKLSCQLYQRSGDAFLGVPFNIASYALLTMMVAQVCDLELGEFIHTFGDAHIYLNHMEQVEELLSREPRSLPQLHLNPAIKKIGDFVYEDFELTNYNPHPHIPAPVAK